MASDAIYDVFLSYAREDAPAVEELAHRLRKEGLKPFLDKWHLVPGEPWQEALEEALDRSRTYAVFLGSGLGPWMNEELKTALTERAERKHVRVIPVLLPGTEEPEATELPLFLRRLTWVDLRGRLNEPQAFHRLVSGIKGVPPGKGPTTMIGVPQRNPFFIGRETLLVQLHQQLQTAGITALAQAVMHGLGGIGKTQTAIEYAHRFGQHYRFVLWVLAERESTLEAAYLAIARELGLVEAQDDIDTAVRAVKVWLSREDGWLLVLDNADDPALVRAYLPVTWAGGKVLLTSRAKSLATVGIREPFRVETLDPEDAVQFLLVRTGSHDTWAAAELAAELGYLPLALEQAAAYVDTVSTSLSDYLTSFKRRGLQLLAKGKPGEDYPASVATTWNLSFTNIKKASPSSAELLTAAAFLVPHSVPIEIFTLGSSELGGQLAQALKNATEDPIIGWELLRPLERYSLVERLPDDAFKLHRLTQEMVKDSLGEKGRRDWAERVVRALNAAYPEVEFKNWKLCERLQPHARLASEMTRTHGMESAEAGRLFGAAGLFASARGDYADAKHFHELSLGIYERVLGGEDSGTLMARNNLANSLRALGDLARARKLQEQTLEILERVLGGEHPNTLAAMNNLAETLSDLGNLAGARKLQEQTLESRERVLGGEHPETLISRNNLGATLQALGDLAGARKLHEQTLEIVERVLGGEHPHTLTSMHNLARTLDALGDLTRARKLHEQTLEIRERVLGGEHPDTLASRSNLRDLEWTQNIRAAAQDLEAARSTESHYQRRQALTRARKNLEWTLGRLTLTDEQRFLRPVRSLLDRVADEEAALAALERERPQVPLVFVAGPALTPVEGSLFVGRRDLVRLLDQDLATERPVPLVLLGQRRMGKSTLLNFLPRLLGTGTRVVRLDFQGLSGNPLRGEPHRWVAKEVAEALSYEKFQVASRPPEMAPWGAVLDWLAALEGPLAAADRRLLIALDEIEGLERGIREGWSDPAFLDFLRAVGDRLRRSRFLLVTAHPFSRLGPHWSDRLISAQTRRIEPLAEEEARALLTQPVSGFPKIYPPGGVERLLIMTACHPYLLQLTAYDLTRRLNDAGRLEATEDDLTAALDLALEENNLFQYLWDDLNSAEQRLLAALARGEESPEATGEASETLGQARRELAREQLIQRRGEGWQVAVPLFARWIREIGSPG